MGELDVHSYLENSTLVFKWFLVLIFCWLSCIFKMSQEHNILQNATKRREIIKMKNDVESRNWAVNCWESDCGHESFSFNRGKLWKMSSCYTIINDSIYRDRRSHILRCGLTSMELKYLWNCIFKIVSVCKKHI